MKKSQLRKIIRESIRGLMTEQERGGSRTCFATTTVDTSERPIKKQGFNDYHTWEVCSMSASGTIVTASWTGAFSFAALGPTSGAGAFGPTGTLNAFYAWVVGQIGAINVGDSFTFEMTGSGMCDWLGHNNIDSVCFKYLGLLPLNVGTGWNGTNATAISGDCCSDISRGDDERGCMDPNAINNGECCPGNNYPGCVPNIPTTDCCRYEGDDPCAIFYAMSQNQQDGCCEKCQGNISPSDPCYQYCDCCKRDLGGDDPCKTNPNPECFWCSEEGGPGGCQPVGGNLMYAQANGFSLYQNSADCNTAEPGCRREDPVDTCKTNPKDCWFCKSPGNPCIQFSTMSANFTAGYSGTKYPTSNACNTACGTTGPIDDFPVGLDESFIRMQKLANIK